MKTASAPWLSRFRIRPLTIFIVLTAAVLSYVAAQLVLRADWGEWSYAAIVIVGGVFVVRILSNWRNGVYFFLSWLLFEDFARKFLGNNMVIYFAKDFLALIVFISFMAAYRHNNAKGFRPPFLASLLIFMAFSFIQVFNPASSHIMYGLMGFKLFFYYVPFLFLGYALIDSEEELRKFFRVNLILALIIIALGISQSITGPKFLNPERPADDIKALSTLYRESPMTGSIAYRPTSVFVSAGRYSNFVIVAWLMALGFSGYLLLRSKRGRVLVFVALAVTASGAFLTASRGTFMWSVISVLATGIAFIWGTSWRQRHLRVFRSIRRVGVAIAVGIVLLLLTYPEAVMPRLAIYRETLMPDSPRSELVHRGWSYPVQNLLAAFEYDRWPWGYGLGTTALGGQYVARFFNVRPPVGGVESGWGTLVVEMGIGGLILWGIMSLSILFFGWKVVKKLRGSPFFPLSFVIFWYAFMMFVPFTYSGIQAYEDFLLNAYLWLTLGLLFRLPTVDLSSQFSPQALQERPQPFGIR